MAHPFGRDHHACERTFNSDGVSLCLAKSSAVLDQGDDEVWTECHEDSVEVRPLRPHVAIPVARHVISEAGELDRLRPDLVGRQLWPAWHLQGSNRSLVHVRFSPLSDCLQELERTALHPRQEYELRK